MVEAEMEIIRVTLVIDGPAISDTYPLVATSSLILDAARLLRGSVEDVLKKSSVSVPIRIEIDVGFPRQGSYVQDIVLRAKEVANYLGPAFAVIPIANIIKYLNESLQLAERLRKLARRDKRYSVQHGDDGAVLTTGDHDDKVHVPAKFVREIEPTLKLLSALDQRRFSSLELRTADGQRLILKYEPTEPLKRREEMILRDVIRELRLEKAQHDGRPALPMRSELGVLTEQQRALPREMLNVVGTIREFDFDKRTGRFLISGGETIHFEITESKLLKRVRSLVGTIEVAAEFRPGGRESVEAFVLHSIRRHRSTTHA